MSNILYAAAPTHERLFGIRLDSDWLPVACDWRYGTVTTVAADLRQAACEASELSESGSGEAWMVVVLAPKSPFKPFSAWEIERALPVLFFRGDMYGIVDEGAEGDFIKELQ